MEIAIPNTFLPSKSKLPLIFALFFLSFSVFGQEICDNSIDDDGDGLIDLNDSDDCQCSGSSTFIDIIPNPSFEEIECCPEDFEFFGNAPCLTDWQLGNAGTADHLNTCDFTTEGLPLPLPDGEGAIGFAAGIFEPTPGIEQIGLEYMATCLQGPLEVGTEYNLTFSIAAALLTQFGENEPINFNAAPITLYGVPNCNDPLLNSECPEDFGWVALGSIQYEPINQWQEVTMPLEVNDDFEAIAIGVGCNLDDSYFIDITAPTIVSPYFYVDDLSLFEGTAPISDQVELTYSNCNESATLQASTGNFTYQWYFEGIAIAGATGPELFIELGEGSELNDGPYSLLLTDQSGNCTIETIDVEGLQNDLIIGGEPTTGCPPLTVNFDSANTPGGLTLEWFIDGQTFQGEFLDYTFENPGTYPITAQYIDANGCVFSAETDDPIVVSDNPTLTPQFSVSEGCAPFTVGLSVTEISVGCTWTLDDGTVIADDCNSTYLYDGETDFTVNVSSNIDGCESEGSGVVPISIVTNIDYSIEGDLEFCEGESSLLTASPISNTYIWNGTETGPNFEVNQAGTYTLDIIDPNGCQVSESFTATTLGNPQPSVPPTIEACLGDPLNFSIYSNGNQLTLDTATSPTAIELGGTVVLLLTNECGTTSRDVEVIREDCDCKVYIPNAFTPDGDGINDLFQPQINCELSEYKLAIYNRWGEAIFRSEDPNKAWNGSSGSQDFFSPAEVYTYILRYDGANSRVSEPIELVGSVSIVR